MTQAIGRGLLGSLRKRIQWELDELARQNSAMRRARYSLGQRILRAIVGGRSIANYLFVYYSIAQTAAIAELAIYKIYPGYLLGWTSPNIKDLIQEAGTTLITSQVAMLGIVSLAVAIVALIAQRNDGSSGNTDIRLYYFQSLSYEVAKTGIALFIVLVVQKFWPLQFLLHESGYGGSDLIFKVSLTVLHVAWIILNILAFAQFISTTLSFVDPKEKAAIREKYTANIVIPRDLTMRLTRSLYMGASKEILPESLDRKGPSLTFGFGLSDDGEAEFKSWFKRESRLHDVRFTLLTPIIRHWWARSKAAAGPDPNPNSLFGRNVRLAFGPSIDTILSGSVSWCKRKGGLPFTLWERCIIWLSFSFKKDDIALRDMPTPLNFIEELNDKVIGQIERSAITSFRSALDDVVEFHRFVLDVQDTRSAEGLPLSFAEIGGFFEAPFSEWVRKYRRVFEVAASKIDVEPAFMDSLSYLARRLLPMYATDISNVVIISLLELGRHEVVVLQAWVTKHTSVEIASSEEAQPRLVLAGSSRRAYERVVINFVGAWEDLLRIAEPMYELSSNNNGTTAQHWVGLGRMWPYLNEHLKNTAYFFASAVWNEEEIGAERFRDMLIRWLDTARPDNEGEYNLKYHTLLTPDILILPWEVLDQRLMPFRRYPGAVPDPRGIFSVVVKRVQEDTIILSALTALGWYSKEQQATDIGARAAKKLLRREVIAEEGARHGPVGMPSPPILRSIFNLIIRECLSVRLGEEAGYSAQIHGLVRFLNGMSERNVVPGRVYTVWGWGGIDSLHPQLLAMAAAHLPAEGDDGLVEWIKDIAKNDQLIPAHDEFLCRIVHSFQTLQRALAFESNIPVFRRAYSAFNLTDDGASASGRLDDILKAGIDSIETIRRERLKAQGIDSVKINALRDLIISEVFSKGPQTFALNKFQMLKGNGTQATKADWRLTGIDKGAFVTPAMSPERSGDLNPFIADRFREHLGRHLWYHFGQRGKRQVEVVGTAFPEGYMDTVVQEAQNVGPNPVLIAPYDPVGEMITSRLYITNNDEASRNSPHTISLQGGGMGCMGNIDGLNVYRSDDTSEKSFIFSSDLLESISLHPVDDDGNVIKITFEDGADPSKGAIYVEFALSFEWRDYPIVRLILTDESESQTPV